MALKDVLLYIYIVGLVFILLFFVLSACEFVCLFYFADNDDGDDDSSKSVDRFHHTNCEWLVFFFFSFLFGYCSHNEYRHQHYYYTNKKISYVLLLLLFGFGFFALAIYMSFTYWIPTDKKTTSCVNKRWREKAPTDRTATTFSKPKNSHNSIDISRTIDGTAYVCVHLWAFWFSFYHDIAWSVLRSALTLHKNGMD